MMVLMHLVLVSLMARMPSALMHLVDLIRRVVLIHQVVPVVLILQVDPVVLVRTLRVVLIHLAVQMLLAVALVAHLSMKKQVLH